VSHLALAVRDEERSRRFYETYFGFDAFPAERMSDGVLMLYDAGEYALALKETDERTRCPASSISASVVRRAPTRSVLLRIACGATACRSSRSGRSPTT
jgi:catechol 2,3-dioxygenase-like lactoylglutathione lyase family enzyme